MLSFIMCSQTWDTEAVSMPSCRLDRGRLCDAAQHIRVWIRKISSLLSRSRMFKANCDTEDFQQSSDSEHESLFFYHQPPVQADEAAVLHWEAASDAYSADGIDYAGSAVRVHSENDWRPSSPTSPYPSSLSDDKSCTTSGERGTWYCREREIGAQVPAEVWRPVSPASSLWSANSEMIGHSSSMKLARPATPQSSCPSSPFRSRTSDDQNDAVAQSALLRPATPESSCPSSYLTGTERDESKAWMDLAHPATPESSRPSFSSASASHSSVNNFQRVMAEDPLRPTTPESSPRTSSQSSGDDFFDIEAAYLIPQPWHSGAGKPLPVLGNSTT